MKPIFKHRHKWQTRGVNRFGTDTYRICLKCRVTQQRTNKPFKPDLWTDCDPIPELDNQFDGNDQYIFNHEKFINETL